MSAGIEQPDECSDAFEHEMDRQGRNHMWWSGHDRYSDDETQRLWELWQKAWRARPERDYIEHNSEEIQMTVNTAIRRNGIMRDALKEIAESAARLAVYECGVLATNALSDIESDPA